MKNLKTPIGLLTLLVALAACTAATPAAPTFTPPPPASPTVSPTITAFPTSPLAARTQQARASATAAAATRIAATLPPTPDLPPREPQMIVTGSQLVGGNWSPDSRWISFWSPMQHAGDPGVDPGKLTPGFYNVETAQTCYHEDYKGLWYPEFTPTYSYWEPDGRAVLVVEQKPFTGTPCGAFVEMIPSKHFDPWAQAISPDGRYRAETTYQRDPNIATTIISTMQTDAVVQAIKWQHPGGQVGGVMGMWIGNDKFLLLATVDQGPLLVNVGGVVVPVISGLFGLNVYADDLGNFLAAGALDEAAGRYHILLFRPYWERESSVQLYHSESGRVERLPFSDVWGFNTAKGWQPGFSPDGAYLLLRKYNDYHAAWIRPVDGGPVETRIVGYSAGYMDDSGPTHLAAFSYQGIDPLAREVFIMHFPEGEVIQRWSSERYVLNSIGWSPDGKKLLMMGYLIAPTDPSLTATPPYFYYPDSMALLIADVRP